MMRLLLAEDDKRIASFVIKGLKQAGYVLDWASDGELALDRALEGNYDLAIVDVMLPKRDGLSLITEMRKSGIAIPVIILSAKRSVDDRVKGLEKGGDDYLVKPFSFVELLARVQAQLRRANQTAEPTSLTVANLCLDVLTREVFRGEEKIELPPREFALLEYLMRQAGKVISKTSILEKICDYHIELNTNLVDVMICRLRTKVDEGFEPKLIQTVRGMGYALRPT